MRAYTASRLAWGLGTLAVFSTVLSVAFSIAGETPGNAFDLVFVLFDLVFCGVGALVASRHPRNPIGWIFLAVGLGIALDVGFTVIAGLLAEGGDHASILSRVAAWTEGWTWVPVIFVPTTFPLLLFPDGRLPSPRWRPLLWMAAIGVPAFSFSMAFNPENFGGRSPLGIQPPALLVDGAGVLSVFLIAAVIGGGIAVAVRFRRSTGDERQQLKWLAYAGVIATACVVGSFVVGAVLSIAGVDMSDGSTAATVSNGLIIVSVLSIPSAMGLGILRYRLYDIDLVIKKTVLYGVLAVLLFTLGALVAWVLAGVVVAGGDEDGYAYLAAGIVVGLAVWPLRKVATRIADRLVFGRRATPYEVLSEFSGRVAETYAADDVLRRMAEVLGGAVGAEASTVWLRVDDHFRAAASWPGGIDAEDGRVPPSAVEVRHRGEVLGALSVRMPANDPMNPSKERLIRDLAGQTGLVLRNAALIEDLRASRQRLVAAQDEERRRIERNIHDGAQQQLVALAVKLKLADSLVGKDEDRAHALLGELHGETSQALEDLRDLARGIYPPLLADKGLGAALESQSRKSAIPVSVEADGLGRYPQEAEAAVYFSCLEALQNVAKYADATRTTIRLAQTDGVLTFEVEDDGRGFDPEAVDRGTGLQGIADRLAALGGEVEIRSAPGDGTTLARRVPVEVGR